jgi:lipopolysaccharide/colanic/teichoic acid biosynthesis glycosyltransferase
LERSHLIAKRAIDLACASVGLAILSPVLLVVGALVKIESPGPVFYRGARTGLRGKPFRIFKFRTMVSDAESRGGHSTAVDDPRLTRVGPLLRRYKLDELPQLFNVLTGEMSIVGPRPQVARYTSAYTAEQQQILSVRPGLTDYASIEFIDLDRILGSGDVDAKYLRDIEPRKNDLRMKYVREQSIVTDLKIIAQTVLQMTRIRRRWNTDS